MERKFKQVNQKLHSYIKTVCSLQLLLLLLKITASVSTNVTWAMISYESRFTISKVNRF